jgi:hypothetical protein
MHDDLVDKLARLNDDGRDEIVRKARATRRRLKQTVVVDLKRKLRPLLKSERRVAQAIDDAVNNRHGRFDSGLLGEIRRTVEKELGTGSALPGPDSMRRW